MKKVKQKSKPKRLLVEDLAKVTGGVGGPLLGHPGGPVGPGG